MNSVKNGEYIVKIKIGSFNVNNNKSNQTINHRQTILYKTLLWM